MNLRRFFVSFQSGKWGRPLHDENSAIGFAPYFGRKGALHPDPDAHFYCCNINVGKHSNQIVTS